MMTYKDSLWIIWKVRSGNTNKLKNQIGEKNFERAIKEEIIMVGKSFPDVWKITESGLIILRRYYALKTKSNWLLFIKNKIQNFLEI